MPDEQTDDSETRDSGEGAWALGITLAIAGTFLFALKSIFIKLSFLAGADPLQLLALRMVCALPFYVIVWNRLQKTRQGSQPPRSIKLQCVGLGFLGYYLASYLDLQGLAFISAQLERLTLFTYPALIAVLAWAFLGEVINWKIGLAIVLCYSGVALMYSGETQFESTENTALGVCLVIGAALSYSVYVVLAKPIMTKVGSTYFTSLAMMGSTFFVGVHFAVIGSVTELASLRPIVFVYAVLLGLVCTVLPSYMINAAILKIGATRTTVIGSVGPVLTMLLAVMWLEEPTSWKHFAGMLLAIGGVSLVAKK